MRKKMGRVSWGRPGIFFWEGMLMATVWSLFFTFCWYLPWVAIAVMGALALRQKQLTGLLLQAAGASALFLLGMGQWVVLWVLRLVTAPVRAMTAAATIFEFLLFVS